MGALKSHTDSCVVWRSWFCTFQKCPDVHMQGQNLRKNKNFCGQASYSLSTLAHLLFWKVEGFFWPNETWRTEMKSKSAKHGIKLVFHELMMMMMMMTISGWGKDETKGEDQQLLDTVSKHLPSHCFLFSNGSLSFVGFQHLIWVNFQSREHLISTRLLLPNLGKI
jgi:hypothetical protein